MPAIAAILTILSGVLASFLEPTTFGVSIPIAVMGFFILKEIKKRGD